MDEETRFIGEPIIVEFDRPPPFSKTPTCPDRFIWQDETWGITANLQEWHDYGRRGRMRMNMRPSNQAKAEKRGSWGVGRFYFRVQVVDGRIFDIYYDRAPKGQQQKEGSWHLYREVLGTVISEQ
jgi:hypothetical protein